MVLLSLRYWLIKRASAKERGYDHRWHKARTVYLKENPLCVYHMRLGKVKAATVVDHKIPHKGNKNMFWDRSNWQSLCKHCHDSHKQSEERGGLGINKGCDIDGNPLDPKHDWNR